MERWQSATKSGFFSLKAKNPAFQALCDKKRRKYRETCQDAKLINAALLCYLQLEHGKEYKARTGQDPATPKKIKAKEEKLKKLEAEISAWHTPKKNTAEKISYGGVTIYLGAPGYDRLKKKKESGEIKERAEKARYERMISTPHPEEWEEF